MPTATGRPTSAPAACASPRARSRSPRTGSCSPTSCWGTLTEVDHGISGGVMVVPNFFYAAFYVDHWWFIAVRPISATRTEFFYTWFVREDAEEGVDFDRDRMIEVGHTTQSEDNVLIERTQRGISSRYFTPGPAEHRARGGPARLRQRLREVHGVSDASAANTERSTSVSA